MARFKFIAATILFLTISFDFSCTQAQSYTPGFQRKIAGEDLQYHAPQPDATVSLLVRSEDAGRYIEWESAILPESGNPEPETRNPKPGTFLLLAGIDVNPGDPHSWKVMVNGREMFSIHSPHDTNTKVLTWPGPDGSSMVFKTKEVDKYGDLMGYLEIVLPASMLEAGEPVKFRVTGESAGSRTWFMIFQYETRDQVRLTPEQAVMRGDKGNYQVLRAEIIRYASPAEAKINIAGKKISQNLDFGYNVLYLPVPQINKETSFDLSIKTGKTMIADQTFQVKPVATRTIYLLHHSHNDIGYTHVQDEVEKMQWQNLDRALELIRSTQDYPEGARLKFCTEVMWAVVSWYEKADEPAKAAFRQAVAEGDLELNALYANELISLCGPEELDRLLEDARWMARECGIAPTSAMITDIPGWSWALVPALANSGVKYLSLGTNRNHRIGDILEAWGDKPFFWAGPGGEGKVLCWIHGEGYSLFHTGLAYSAIRKRLQEDLVFGYLDRLARQDYPYEEVMLRYNIGSDNGPVDESLPEAVRAWNEKYVTPRMVISTVSESFSRFEAAHGASLPVVQGDLTCYWEDGAYSTARETIQNRRTASRLIQAQALWAMYNPSGYPEKQIKEAWKNVLLFDEHTWGSWNSISEPDIPFTIKQWEIKKSFAAEAEKQSKKLLFDAILGKPLGGPAADAIEVINSCAWERDGLIMVSGGPQPGKTAILDGSGKRVKSQLLSDGTIAFLAENIPPLGSGIYKIAQGTLPGDSIVKPSPIKDYTIHTRDFTLRFDPETGAIASLSMNQDGRELVDNATHSGLNEYLYVAGRMPDRPQKAQLRSISVTEQGPLFTAIRLELDAPGCKAFSTTIKVFDEGGYVEIINEADREKVYDPEAIHMAFPFHPANDAMIRYDLAYGWCRPEADQLPGSNKNFLAMEHWLDVSARDHGGVTLISPDMPLFEVGAMTMDAVVYGWVDSLPATGTIYSYAMNNYWETNFAAAQEGKCTFRYIIRPHQDHADVATAAEKEAISQRQPLITRKGGGWQMAKKPLIELDHPELLITAVKPLDMGTKLLVTVQNTGTSEAIPRWSTSLKIIALTDPDGIVEKNTPVNASIPAGGIRFYTFHY